MSRDAVILLSEIQEAATEIIDFTRGMSLEEFLADKKTRRAVIRCFEVMGEAAKALPQSIRNAHPDVPWRQICGMRDVLIHQYLGVDEKLLWRAVERDIPPILVAVTWIISTL